jgi:hypothetical protein
MWRMFGILLLASNAFASVPSAFSVQGVLRDNAGQLQSMQVSVSVSLFDAQTNGNKIGGPYTSSTVMATNGLFTFPITDANLTTELASASQVWLEVTVGSDVFARQLVNPQLFAVSCGTADVANSYGGSSLSISKYSTDINPAWLFLNKANGTAASPAPVATGDILGQIAGMGYTGSTFAAAGSIRFRATENFTPTAQGNAIDFFVGANGGLGGTDECMVLDQNGNVGIGTTAPSSKLYVSGAGYNGGYVVAESTDNGNAITILGKDHSGLNDIAFLTLEDGTVGDRAFIGLTGTAAGPVADLRFITGNQERMRIAKGGKVGIGITSPAYALDVSGEIQASTDVKANGVILTSDARLKTNIRPIEHALDDVERLRGVRFTWKKDGKPSVGVIAQDVQRVYPELVSTGADGYMGVDYPKLVGTLIESTKELRAENRALRERLERIEARLDKRAAR